MQRVIEWFARNGVAANLLMALIVVGGLVTATRTKQEVFPEFALGLITVSVEYRGAAPEEVEEAICMRVEEALYGVDDVKEITSRAQEGLGVVTLELTLGAEASRVLDDVKSRIDAIDTFPEETEKPVVQEVTNRRQVISIAVSGDADEHSLKRLGERVRDEISALPGITLAELSSARPYEISIEISEDGLRRHGLTFDEVAAAVRRSSIDLPGGSVKTEGGEILLRTKGQAYRGDEFAALVLLTRDDGTHVRLGEVARVVDGFAETDQATRFDGQPAVVVDVFRTGEQDALGVAAAVYDYIDAAQARMPEGIKLTAWQDAAKILRDRLDLLTRNAIVGFALVFVMLTLFLRFRLAFWVSLGIPISFLGAVWLMPTLDVSVNMISLFAFIVVLGIVVDDAIIVGENIYSHQQRHRDGLRGSIEGASEVNRPVIFAVLTSIAAFAPLLNVEGTIGKVMRVIPLIVLPCLAFSLIESLWILPHHLSRLRPVPKDSAWRRFQGKFADGLQRFVERIYRPSLELGLRWRYATVALGIATLLMTAGFVGGGYIGFVFFPDVEADFISASLKMPQGTPARMTSQAVAQLEDSLDRLRAELTEQGGDEVLFVIAAVGEQPWKRIQQQNAGGAVPRELASNLGEVTAELTSAEVRDVSATDLARRWRELTGPIADAVELSFSSSLFSPGDDINVQLSGPDIGELVRVSDELKRRLAEYGGVYSISDSFLEGKREVKLGITPQAETWGLTLADLGRQVRQAFYGEEVQRIQRGRDELRVMLRYPESERRSLGDLENMRVRTPDGRAVPFAEVATIELGRGYASIRRVDRRRVVNVTANVDPAQASAGDIIADLQNRVLPGLLATAPGIGFTFEGQQAEQRETLSGLRWGFALALVVIYGLLAVPLRSYSQPLVIMAAIPFGLVGAVWGHAIMGMPLTILSMFGIVALAGVVVNDSLVMVDFINRHRETREELLLAVRTAGMARFRPILLTSLTTFVGLTPLLLERSMQARFLIPMAISLAFGVLFSTFITLVLIPAGYMILEDVKDLPARVRRRGGSTSIEGEVVYDR